ncbi:hypothetical protein KDL01_30140 [Actinospica durhamensis]|uniref:HNH endonuclease n=1 Tax=Actinospica durhamensis TaxID=1508375 RepID=A0A941EUP9_9ACTN|nr:hypothetical protein [Actinospica durhamensis]MBR7837578.1 hypothetical protein [Actinospica durhamensis]
MIPITRLELPERTRRELEDQTTKIAAARDRLREAHRLWQNRIVRTAILPVLRGTLAEMCPGIKRCMYCGDSLGTDIEHFEPVKLRPIRAFDWHNHLLACSYCNSRQKQDKFPLAPDGTPMLLDPTVDDPAEHLHLALSAGVYLDLSPRGKVTIDLLDLNRGELVKGREHALRANRRLLRDWREAAEDDDVDAVHECLGDLREQPVAEVALALLQQGHSAAVAQLFGRDPATLAHLRRPETLALAAEVFTTSAADW